MNSSVLEKFSLKGQTAIITGGAGLLGRQHAAAVIGAGANCIVIDINQEKLDKYISELKVDFPNSQVLGIKADITCKIEVENLLVQANQQFNSINILINNAAINPTLKKEDTKEFSRFENFLVEQWDKEIAVGLTGAFICCQVIGSYMASLGKGVILNIASDLAVIAPDQRIYKCKNRQDGEQPVKPVTYSVIKSGLLGLTRYLATYWADKNVRVNALSPGGVYDKQPDDFVQRLTNLIPMGRMANKEEYQAAVLFLVSEASSYMTGANVVIDGGRTCW